MDYLDKRILKLSEILKKGSYVVVYTGAGISTSAGLPDYRGVTGIRNRKRKYKSAFEKKDIAFEDLQPTKTHMAIRVLLNEGFIQHIITQNIDGLHYKSGIDAKKCMEFHGSLLDGVCDTCGEVYYSSDSTPHNNLCVNELCPAVRNKTITQRLECRTRRNGKIVHKVVKFNDEVDLDSALEIAEKADVAIVIGTSLKVEPFASLPLQSDSICIINLQKMNTKVEKIAKKNGIVIYEDCDTVMENLMKALKNDITYEIPTLLTNLVPKNSCNLGDKDTDDHHSDKLGERKSFKVYNSNGLDMENILAGRDQIK